MTQEEITKLENGSVFKRSMAHAVDGVDHEALADGEIEPLLQAAFFNAMRDEIYEHNLSVGWWDEIDKIKALDVDEKFKKKLLGNVIACKIALIHSEASEGLEGDRKQLMDDKLPDRTMLEVELADVIIRVLDLAGALSLDIGGALVAKRKFNAVRKDHTREHRAGEHGKAY